MLKLNLGCGLQCPDGWLNIDSSIGVKLSKYPIFKKAVYAVIPQSFGLPNKDWTGNAMWMDLTKQFKFENEKVDCIYSSHTFEHLTFEETAFAFKECYRIMKPSGIIRIIVPDLSDLINNYLKNKIENPSLAAYNFNFYSRYFEIPSPNNVKDLFKFYFKRKNNHAFLYDKDGLQFQLEKAGFTQVTEKSFQDSEIPNINEIDIENRFAGAICLEARKM